MSVRLVCPGCGSHSVAGARFCPSCGESLADLVPARGGGAQGRDDRVLGRRELDAARRGARPRVAAAGHVALLRGDARGARAARRRRREVHRRRGDVRLRRASRPRGRRAPRRPRRARDARGARPPQRGVRPLGGRHARDAYRASTPARSSPATTTTRQSFVAGDAVNVAARLEQAAEPGEILIADATHRLVRAAVVAEQVGPLAVKGRVEGVSAWRLLEVVPGAEGWRRHLDSPLVGRDAAARPRSRRSSSARSLRGTPQLVTVMGPAGIGKSRLTGEFLSRLGDRGSVVASRCLPYGEGITFWPVVTALKDSLQISDRDSPAAARREGLRPASGRSGQRGSSATGWPPCSVWRRRCPASRRRSGRSASCSRLWRRRSRSWWSSTTSNGASRRSSTCSSTSPTGSEAGRS